MAKNDNKKKALAALGKTGSLTDMIQENAYWKTQPSAGTGATNDIMRNVLRAKGYTGTINDMEAAHWSASAGTTNPFTSAIAAYSTRKLVSGYAGKALKVRRSSDSTTLDIGFTAGGDLDTTALLAFVGAGSGFVDTWYDQSGNARNLTQATLASQPRIVNAGTVDVLNGKPSVYNTGSTLIASASFPVPQPCTRASVLKIMDPANTTFNTLLRCYNGANNQIYTYANILYMHAPSDVGTTVTINAGNSLTCVEMYNGASSKGRINGTETTGNPGTNGIDGLTVGATGNAYVGDVAIFSTFLSQAEAQALEANMKAYWGTP